MIEIVNGHWYKKKPLPDGAEWIDRRSVLGNHAATHLTSAIAEKRVATRDEAVAEYNPWLIQRLSRPSPERTEFLRLLRKYKDEKSLILVCWCAPANCHGLVLRDLLLRVSKRLSGR